MIKKVYYLIKGFLEKHPVLAPVFAVVFVFLADIVVSFILKTNIEWIPLALCMTVCIIFVWEMMLYNAGALVTEKREKTIRTATVCLMIAFATFALWAVFEAVIILLRIFGLPI